MKAILVLLTAAMALSGVVGVAAATDSGSGPPPWPDNGTTTGNDTAGNVTGVPPGQQLAGAVGAQAASVEAELWNRSLSDRLADAATPDERAAVLADEAGMIDAYLDELAGVRTNVTGAWENGTISEGEYRTSLSAFVVRANATERRANRTARAVEDLPRRVLDGHDVNETYAGNLSERARDLTQFEDEIAREVANETLSNESAMDGIPVGVDESNRSTPWQ